MNLPVAAVAALLLMPMVDAAGRGLGLTCATVSAESFADSALDQPIQALAAAGATVYAAQGDALLIVDASDPGHLVHLGTRVLGGPILDLEVGDGVLYAVVEGQGIALLDLAVPQAPAVLPGVELAGALDLDLGVDRLLAAVGDGVVVLERSDPRAPRELARLAVPAARVRAAGARGFALQRGAFAVLDLADPTDPRLVAGSHWPLTVTDLEASGDLAYVPDERGLHVIDVGTPGAVRQLAVFPLRVTDVAGELRPQYLLRGDGVLWLGAYDGVRALDVSGESPRLVGGIGTVEVMTRPLLVGDALLVAGERGLVAVDVSTPAAPRVFPERPRLPWPLGVIGQTVVVGDGVLASDLPRTIRVLDQGSPALTVRSSFTVAGGDWVTLHGRWVVAGSFAHERQLWDLGAPSAPWLRAAIPAGLALHEAYDDLLFLTRREPGTSGEPPSETLVTLRVGEPGLSTLDEQLLSTADHSTFEVDGDRLYRLLHGGERGGAVEVFALAVGAAPRLLGEVTWDHGSLPVVSAVRFADGRVVRDEGAEIVVYELDEGLAAHRVGDHPIATGTEWLQGVREGFILVGGVGTSRLLDARGAASIVARADIPAESRAVVLSLLPAGEVLGVEAVDWRLARDGSPAAWRGRLTRYGVTGCLAAPPPPCVAGETVLCLDDGRFEMTAAWATAEASGTARVRALNETTGSFWFFREDNLELLVKVLDGCPVNRSHWAFGAGLTDVETRVRVRDTETGALHLVYNPSRSRFAPFQSTRHLQGCDELPAVGAVDAQGVGGPSLGSPRPTGDGALLLGDGRFEVRAHWTRSDGSSGDATAVPLTADSGGFWFFREDNLELMVKVLDACAAVDRFWVFAAGLTNVAVEWSVLDRESGAIRHYLSPAGPPFATVSDTSAFVCD